MSSDNGKTSKKQRRGDKLMNEARTRRNKARRIAKDARRQEQDRALRGLRQRLRAKGALKRFERRYAAIAHEAAQIKTDEARTLSLEKLQATRRKIHRAAS